MTSSDDSSAATGAGPEPLHQRLVRLGRDTVQLGLIGGDIAHSNSPRLHEAALHRADLPGEYRLFPCADAAAADAILTLLEDGELDGLNVTAPFKAWAARRCRHQTAATLDSVNTLCADASGHVYGYSTDGAGLCDALGTAGIDVRGAHVALIGLGAAGVSILEALRVAGVARVTLANRTDARSRSAARAQSNWRTELKKRGDPRYATEATFSAIPWGDGRRLADADLVLHASAFGHGAGFSQPRRSADFTLPAWAAGRKHWEPDAFAAATLAMDWLPWSAWRARGTVVFDAVYATGVTWFQAIALQHGLPADLRLMPRSATATASRPATGVLLGSGDAMLVRQAARSFALWLGRAC